jgi:hypothetical protein
MNFSKVHERRSELRNASILEVVLAIILMLLVFIHITDVNFTSSKLVFQKTIEDLRNEVEGLKQLLADTQSKNRFLSQANRKLEEKVRLLSLLTEGNGGTANIADEINKLHDELEDAKRKIEDLEASQKGNGKGGSGQPRCVSEFGPVQWLLEIKVQKAGYWISLKPEEKVVSDLLKKVEGLDKLQAASASGNPITPTQFGKLADPIYRWSAKQKPSCRFRVLVWDSEEYDKYDNRRIGRYFYPKPIWK